MQYNLVNAVVQLAVYGLMEAPVIVPLVWWLGGRA